MTESDRTVEVHNVYTLYELNEDGSAAENKLVCFNRPQDWGSSRWNYYRCKVEFESGGTRYINNCHLWQEVARTPTEAFQAIAPYLFMVLQPGSDPELSGREYLAEEDFWDEEWGKMPPIFESQEDGYDYEPYSDEDQDRLPVGGILYLWRVWHPNQDAAVLDARENPFGEPPISEAQHLYDLTKIGDRYSMRCEEHEPFYGLMFGTHLEETPTLNPAWSERGWQLESQGTMKKLAD